MIKDKLKERGFERVYISLNTINDIKEFSDKANKYKTDLFLIHNDYCIDAKSIMGILSLDLNSGNIELWFDNNFVLATLEDFKQWIIKY